MRLRVRVWKLKVGERRDGFSLGWCNFPKDISRFVYHFNKQW
jgi:hypothetical protein